MIFLLRILLLLLFFSLFSCKKDPPIPAIPVNNNDSIIITGNCDDLPPSSNFTGYQFTFPDFFFNSPNFNPNNSSEIVFRKKNLKNLSEPEELWRLNIVTGENTLLIKNIWYQPKWNINNWIVFNRSDKNIWKIKSNGDSLTQLTFQNENYSPEWNFDGNKIVYRKVIGSNYYLMIMNENGKTIDSIPNIIFSNGSWSKNNNKIATIIGSEASPNIGYFDLNSKKLVQITNNPFPSNSSKDLVSAVSWLNWETILWTNGNGIFKTNINSRNTCQLKSACTSKYYLWPSISFDEQNLIIDRITKSIVGENIVYIKTDLVLINLNLNDEKDLLVK